LTSLGALGSRLEERLTTRSAIVGVVLVVDTRNATGPLGAHRHVIRI